jgi:hypothetical protein
MHRKCRKDISELSKIIIISNPKSFLYTPSTLRLKAQITRLESTIRISSLPPLR